jgi:Fe-S cluster assembly iron-binding protein IscA
MRGFDPAFNLDQMRKNFPQPSSMFGRWVSSPEEKDLIPEQDWRGDPLYPFWKVQKQLLQAGKLVWSARIQANYQLYKPGTRILPGEIATGFDPEFDEDPDSLIRVADRIRALKGTQPDDKQLRQVADRITDEMYRSLGEKIPDKLTVGREVFRYTIIFYPKHLPHGFINHRLMPVLIHKGISYAMILPHWYWSEGLLKLWEPKAEQVEEFNPPPSRRAGVPLVRLTHRAIDMIHTLLQQEGLNPTTMFVRLELAENRVKLWFDPNRSERDHQLVIEGITVLVDPETAQNHWGSEIDFIDEGTRRGFTVNS